MGVLNRTAIKKEAKSFISIDTRWAKMFFAAIFIYLLQASCTLGEQIYDRVNGTAIRYFSDYYYQNPTFSLWGIGGVIIAIITAPFLVSIAGYYLNHIRGFNPDWRSIYKEGFDNFGNYITVKIVQGIAVMLWSLLLVIPGVIKAYAYSQVDYIIHDNNKLSPGEAMKMSDIMTKGYKSDIFILHVSFVLWIWLSAFTFGIASIYVTPYFNTTSAMYYENLKRNAIEKGLIAPEAFGMVADYGAGAEYSVQNAEPGFDRPDPESTFNPDFVDNAIRQESAENNTQSINNNQDGNDIL